MQITRALRRSMGGAVAAIVFVLAASQIACNDNNYRSPTAPTPPTPQPQPVVIRAQYIFLVEPTNPEASYPKAGELLVDGQTVWAGLMGEPTVLVYNYYGTEYPGLPFSINSEVVGALSPGAHALSFRVTDQGRSPTRYTISGRVDVVWNNHNVSRAGDWTDVLVRLSTGELWTAQFVVPPTPN